MVFTDPPLPPLTEPGRIAVSWRPGIAAPGRKAARLAAPCDTTIRSRLSMLDSASSRACSWCASPDCSARFATPASNPPGVSALVRDVELFRFFPVWNHAIRALCWADGPNRRSPRHPTHPVFRVLSSEEQQCADEPRQGRRGTAGPVTRLRLDHLRGRRIGPSSHRRRRQVDACRDRPRADGAPHLRGPHPHRGGRAARRSSPQRRREHSRSRR